MRHPFQGGIGPLLSGLADWIYPVRCQGCQKVITTEMDHFCMNCLFQLRPLDINDLRDNYVARHFWGRVRVERAFALFNYYRHSRSQHAIHQIKYSNRKGLARKLGRWLAEEMIQVTDLPLYTLILPVPLHRRKQRERGYNQSAEISKGAAEVLGIRVDESVLRRVDATVSQTGLSRAERVTNMLTAFELCTELPKDGHILVIDDVITTGATIEGCILALQKNGKPKVSVAALAAGGGF